MVPFGGFWRSGWTKSARFKMLADANTGEHLAVMLMRLLMK
jgi:predicted small secreted protein